LAIGADGRQSQCRSAAGIDMRGRTYAQTALTFNLGHSRPHDDTSTEFHTETGPFTLVPLPQRRSSLVFVVDRAEVGNIATLSDAQLAAEIERRLEVTGSGVISSRVARDSTTNRKAACGPSSGGCITPFKAADPRNSYSLQFFVRLP
jgi:2-polyprenyl-6-methoxyphenol hydroxylase-like FAD-dependent oxidoreductase